jgi:hypothetical protein
VILRSPARLQARHIGHLHWFSKVGSKEWYEQEEQAMEEAAWEACFERERLRQEAEEWGLPFDEDRPEPISWKSFTVRGRENRKLDSHLLQAWAAAGFVGLAASAGVFVLLARGWAILWW